MKHIYMGEGKGKTTAAVGLAVRCAGSEMPVLFTQFLKPGKSGELAVLNEIENMQLLLCPGEVDFTWKMSDEEKADIAAVYERYMWDIERVAYQGNFKMLVMDEIIAAVSGGLVQEADLMSLLETLPDEMEIVLTGRHPSETLIAWADYVTEMKKIKHPFDQGVRARKGIEY